MALCRGTNTTMALWRVLARSRTAASQLRGLSNAAESNLEDENAASEEEDLIDQKRNKSRLFPSDYIIHHEQPNKLSEDEEFMTPLKRHRQLYGKYGAASGINVAKLWPSKEELEQLREWEKVARPHSVQEMIRIAKKAKEDEEKAILERQEELKRNVAKLEGWKREVQERVRKKEIEAQEAKEKKEKLIEEVRQILGYKINPKDEKFKEALLKKEQEEKKAKKAAKKLARQQRLLERLRMETESSSVPPEETVSKEEDKEKRSNITPGSSIM